MAIITPEIPALSIPSPPPPPAELAPFVYRAYGTLVLDYLDGRVRDLAAYYTPIAVVRAELELERDKVFRETHRKRREMLAAEGRKASGAMPGYLQRRLLDLDLDEKRTLSEGAAKIVARHAEESLNAVSEGVTLALKSDAVRSEAHYKAQLLSFDAAKAALTAAYEYGKLRVDAFGSWLKAIATDFALVEIECKALAQVVEAEIEAIKIEILAAENIGKAEELEKIAAELEVARKQIEESLSRLPLVEAEIKKAQAELGVLEAEKALATFKELTALASMEKSQARLEEIAVAQQRIELQLAEVGLRTAKDQADTAGELSAIAVRGTEERIESRREELRVVTVESDAELTGIRSEITDEETTAEVEKEAYFRARAASQAMVYANRARTRTSEIYAREFAETELIADSTDNRVENIREIAQNTVQELETEVRITKDDLEARARQTVENLAATTQAHKAYLDSSLSDEKGSMAALLAAEILNLGQKVAVMLQEVYAKSAIRSKLADYQKALLIAHQAEISSKLADEKALLEEEYETWKTAHEAEVAAEAEAIIAAARHASQADVSTEYHYIKGGAK